LVTIAGVCGWNNGDTGSNAGEGNADNEPSKHFVSSRPNFSAGIIQHSPSSRRCFDHDGALEFPLQGQCAVRRVAGMSQHDLGNPLICSTAPRVLDFTTPKCLHSTEAV
jgi:hypothetical protein